MKQAFIDTLTNLMEKQDDIVVVTADMGFSVFEDVQNRFPNRFFNTGITEQASASIAAGLAHSGFTVYFYAQAPFITMRCFEQVRLDIAYNRLNVKLIGSNSGFSLNQYGVSHFGLEDIALMKTLPNMVIYAPADSVEMMHTLLEVNKTNGPAYIRMTKTGIGTIHTKKEINVHSPICLSDGKDGLLLVSGGMLKYARVVADIVEKEGYSIGLYSIPQIKPLNTQMLIKLFAHYSHIFTLEEHSIVGGFGSSIANFIIDTDLKVSLKKFALPDTYLHIAGTIEHLLQRAGLGADTVGKNIIKELKK